MNSVQIAIHECCSSAKNDDELIEKIEQLIQKRGDTVYQVIFSTFTSLELSQEDAKNYWSNILIHRQKLTEALGREVCLVPTMSDYLCSKIRSIPTPKIVDFKSFAKTLKESTHDSLTGLGNRSFFNENLEQQISSASRQDTDLSLLFIDIDDFKSVNDSYGHQAGDLVLSVVAGMIQEEIRGGDIAARYGGEEFVILMPHTDSISALVLAERIREKISEKEHVIDGQSVQITVSGGIASYPVHAQTADDLLNLADSSLYRAKGAGKNHISLFKDDKRRFLRIKLSKEIRIKEMGFTKAHSFMATSKDICIGGILFENSDPIPIGTKIQVGVPITGGTPVLLIGTVVRVEAFSHDCYDIGMTISFKEMEKTAKDEISNFLLKQSDNFKSTI